MPEIHENPVHSPTLQSGAVQSVPLSKLAYAWRTSGLLRAIPSEDLRSLLLVLSFTDARGGCQPTLQQLTHAMQVSEIKARRRLDHLAQFQWQGQPLVTTLRRGNGSDVYMPIPGNATSIQVSNAPSQADAVAPLEATAIAAPQSELVPSEGPPQERPVERPLTQREKVIAASRRKYGRPRAEVERMIAKQMGWAPPAASSVSSPAASPTGNTANSPQPKVDDELKRQLLEVGIDEDRTDSLLGNFHRARIKQQLEWLPYRDARNPAAFLVAAIEHDYEPPLSLRREQVRRERRKAKP